MEHVLLDAVLEKMDDLNTIHAMECGENGWREATIDKGLVMCTSPIKGNVHRVICRGGELRKYLGFAVSIRILGGNLGRVFVDEEGRMMTITELSQDGLEKVAEQIAEDVADMAGLND